MKKIIMIQFVLLCCQCVLYFGCEKFQKKIHDVKRPADDHIPFLPWTVVLYSTWFPLIMFFPLILYRFSPFHYCIYLFSMIPEILLSVLCYLIYPTSFTRPVPPDTFWGRCMKFVYTGSYRGLNCAPSLHCSSCFLVIFCAAVCGNLPVSLKILFIAQAFLIVVSTVTTKQHTVIDVVTALLLFVLCAGLGLSAACSSAAKVLFLT